MMHLLKISKTKKRLSNESHLLWISLLTIFALVSIAVFIFRSTTLSWEFKLVDMRLPIAGKRITKGSHRIIDSTVTIVLGENAFYFGKLSSFGTGASHPSGKFSIAHVNGQPQVEGLIESLKLWMKMNPGVGKGTSVLVPSAKIPMPIVLQTIAYVKESKLFKHVILGGGMI